jgi:hypothetical protein
MKAGMTVQPNPNQLPDSPDIRFDKHTPMMQHYLRMTLPGA